MLPHFHTCCGTVVSPFNQFRDRGPSWTQWGLSGEHCQCQAALWGLVILFLTNCKIWAATTLIYTWHRLDYSIWYFKSLLRLKQFLSPSFLIWEIKTPIQYFVWGIPFLTGLFGAWSSFLRINGGNNSSCPAALVTLSFLRCLRWDQSHVLKPPQGLPPCSLCSTQVALWDTQGIQAGILSSASVIPGFSAVPNPPYQFPHSSKKQVAV